MPPDMPSPSPSNTMVDAEDNIIGLAAATPDLSTLVTAIKAGNLVSTLSSTGPFTVFAPTNEAFAKLPAVYLKQLLDPKNVKLLQKLLEYHVVAGAAVHAADLKLLQFVKTVEGQQVSIVKRDGSVLVNGAKVTTADADASNGVVHIVDTVLLPPDMPSPSPSNTMVDAEDNIIGLAAATPDLSTLVTAIKAGNLVSTLSSTGPFTVFAPTNEAFAKLPAVYLKQLLDPKNVKLLQKLLEYHVVAGAAVHAADLKPFQFVKTVEGQQVSIVKRDGSVLVNGAKVTTADADASNGVVHIVDTVLIPPDMLPAAPSNTAVGV